MEIGENAPDEEWCGHRATYIKNYCINLHAVYCQPKVLEHDRPMSFMAHIMCLVVDQKLGGLKAFACKCLYIEMIYWLPITSIGIFAYSW